MNPSKNTETFARSILTYFKEFEKQNGHTAQIELREYRKGESIYKEKETPKGIYYLQKGTVKLWKHSENIHPPLISLVRSNYLFGYKCMLTNDRYTTGAIAAESCSINFIPKSMFIAVLNNSTAFRNEFILGMNQCLQEAENAIFSLKTESVKKRLASLLISLCRDKYRKNYIRLSKKDLAGILGISPETYSRHQAKLKKEGLIEVKNNYIKVLDLKELKRLRDFTN